MKRGPKDIAAAIASRAGLATGYVASSALLAEGEAWVMGLAVGDHITDAADEEALAKFGPMLPMLLRARGLDYELVEDGVWLVVERERPGLVFNDASAQRSDVGFFVKSKRTVLA